MKTSYPTQSLTPRTKRSSMFGLIHFVIGLTPCRGHHSGESVLTPRNLPRPPRIPLITHGGLGYSNASPKSMPPTRPPRKPWCYGVSCPKSAARPFTTRPKPFKMHAASWRRMANTGCGNDLRWCILILAMSGVWHDGCYKRGGTVHQEGTVLTITLERPARPRWAQAVSGLFALINAQDPRHPADSRYALHFVLKA